MTSIDSIENQKICVELAKSDINNLESSVYKVKEITKNIQPQTNTLDRWIAEASVMDNTTGDRYELNDEKRKSNDYWNNGEHYEMPLRLDWKIFRKTYDIQPQNYEDLISIPGIGPSSVRALSLIGEIIFGTKASWQDPVKFNFAHGGKDGVPYPVARKTYDKSISYLSSAIEGAEIQREERIEVLKKLTDYSNRMFKQNRQ